MSVTEVYICYCPYILFFHTYLSILPLSKYYVILSPHSLYRVPGFPLVPTSSTVLIYRCFLCHLILSPSLQVTISSQSAAFKDYHHFIIHLFTLNRRPRIFSDTQYSYQPSIYCLLLSGLFFAYFFFSWFYNFTCSSCIYFPSLLFH